MAHSLFNEVVAWDNLLRAFSKAARGKRGAAGTARLESRLADELLALQEELRDGSYQPGAYRHFHIKEPKIRKISAAPFRDRVVHHALCNRIEPLFEPGFVRDSYANRHGKGTHRAIDRLQQFAARHTYVLRADIVQHFAAIDHEILLGILIRKLPERSVIPLIKTLVASGDGVLEQQYRMQWFEGDDLLAMCRPRGLPIGNLTSQFWSNCFLDPFDHFVKRELRCKAYLRYVDDFALFGDDKAQLWEWKRALIERLARYRLTIHENACQVMPTRCGIPWLGFVVYPDHRMLKSRKARYASRRLSMRFAAWKAGDASFAELDASVKGWVNHVRFADTWGLRRTVFRRLAAR